MQLADAASRCFGFLMLSFSVNITDKIIALRSYIISGLGIAFCGLFSHVLRKLSLLLYAVLNLGFGPAACSSEAAASREQVLQERFLSQGTNSALKKMLKIVLLLIILLCN